MAKNRREIIYFLANKYDMPLKEVDKIVNYQFKMVRKVMTKGDFETIRLPYFGKFIVNKGRVKHINKLKSEKDIKKI